MKKHDQIKLEAFSQLEDDIITRNAEKRYFLLRNVHNGNRKMISIISVAACLAILVSVMAILLIPAMSKQVPVYQGMTVSNEAPVVQTADNANAGGKPVRFDANRLSSPNLSLSLLGAINTRAPINTDPDTDANLNEGHDNGYSPEVSGGPYYAQPNEDIYIYVHISNPDGFEILSFTLNGVKYSSYMFEPGSDLETLILKYNVGDVEGVQQYTIDALKYVDGKDIKDVRMEGERTIEVLVGSDAQDVNLNTRFDGWNLIVSPEWADTFTGEKKLLSLEVYDGETLLREFDPDTTVIKDLPMDKRLLLVATYSDNGKIVTAKGVIQTPAQSEGLIVVDGVITGIGTCTDTVLYLNMPIAEEAFTENKQITQVYLGSGVTSIGGSAFVYCGNLESIEIGDSLTSIGESAFRECSRLKSITIPDSVTSIGEHAFSYCSSLKSIKIGDSVTSIGRSTFYFCSSLASITIPDSVTSIGEDAFLYCSSLKSIKIGDNVTNIGAQAFINTAYYNDNSNWVNGVLYINNHLIQATRSVTSYDIRTGTVTIAESAFRECTRLTSITIPNSVTSIGKNAFSECSSLTSITIPDSVTIIGENAFGYCSSLESITIPDSVTKLCTGTLVCCSSLTTVTIPDSVKSIEGSVFSQCLKLETINYAGTQESWRAIKKDVYYKDTDHNFTVHCSDGDIIE